MGGLEAATVYAPMIELYLQAWAAWAPGLESPADWQAWAAAPRLPEGEGQAAASRVPPMLRRRLDPLGRAALQVAIEVMDGAAPAATVFVSRRGDSARSLELLHALQRGDGLSPTAFGLSVHNAIAAQYTLTHGQRGAYSALAAGDEGVEGGLVELAAQLAERPDGSGLLVVFEEPVPGPYQAYRDEPDALFAWALRLGRAGPGRRLRLQLPGADAETIEPDRAAGELPVALALFARLLGPAAAWGSGGATRRWSWRLDG